MQMQDMEFMLNLQKFALVFSIVVGLAIIVGAVALCFIASHTAAIRDEVFKMRIEAEMNSHRTKEHK
jgi:ABC-type nickel/cobalt efflux system permease component RcnA